LQFNDKLDTGSCVLFHILKARMRCWAKYEQSEKEFEEQSNIYR
jgi:hypothetical protein